MRRISLCFVLRCFVLPCFVLGWAVTESVVGEEAVFPGRRWETVAADAAAMDAAKLEEARDFALTGQGSGIVTRHGRLVLVWGDPDRRYDLRSTTKSICIAALGLAIADGKAELDQPAMELHPGFGVPPDQNARIGWLPLITLRHLATHTAGFERTGAYGALLYEPGTMWLFSDSGPNWLSECLTLAYRQDMAELLSSRVFTPIGIGRKDLVWREHRYRPDEIDDIPRREFGSGISANVDAMARIGYLYLRGGQWGSQRILPEAFVRECSATPEGLARLPVHPHDKSHPHGSRHYGLLWWTNADGRIPGIPRDAFWARGLGDSLIVVIPSLDIVAARAGRGWSRDEDTDTTDVLGRFLRPLSEACTDR